MIRGWGVKHGDSFLYLTDDKLKVSDSFLNMEDLVLTEVSRRLQAAERTVSVSSLALRR